MRDELWRETWGASCRASAWLTNNKIVERFDVAVVGSGHERRPARVHARLVVVVDGKGGQYEQLAVCNGAHETDKDVGAELFQMLERVQLATAGREQHCRVAMAITVLQRPAWKSTEEHVSG